MCFCVAGLVVPDDSKGSRCFEASGTTNTAAYHRRPELSTTPLRTPQNSHTTVTFSLPSPTNMETIFMTYEISVSQCYQWKEFAPALFNENGYTTHNNAVVTVNKSNTCNPSVVRVAVNSI
jgi:hypothetical protein